MNANQPTRERGWLIIVAAGVTLGIGLGAIDLILQRHLPYPWAMLANSPAVWALVAFGYGTWARGGGTRAAVGGATTLVVAVEAYYVTAALVLGDAWDDLGTPVAGEWLVAGLVAGSVFAVAGAWARGPAGWRRTTGLALGAFVLVAEAALDLARRRSVPVWDHTTQAAVIKVVLAAVLVLAMVGARRRQTTRT